jgi:hypothetical protein
MVEFRCFGVKRWLGVVGGGVEIGVDVDRYGDLDILQVMQHLVLRQ